MWVPSLDLEDPLEEEMAAYCSVLAWEISWREETGDLLSGESMGFQRIEHDWNNLARMHRSLKTGGPVGLDQLKKKELLIRGPATS